MKLTALLALTLLAACSWPFSADEWCRQTHHFTTTDSLFALPDSVSWELEADSVTYEAQCAP